MLVEDNKEILFIEYFRQVLNDNTLHACLRNEAKEAALQMRVVEFVVQDVCFFHFALDFCENSVLSAALEC